MIGTTTRDALQALDEDERTRAIVLVGEIGGAMEEAAADYAAGMSKPVVSFIAGRALAARQEDGHAGAIVSGSFGSYEGKRRRSRRRASRSPTRRPRSRACSASREPAGATAQALPA